MPQGPGALSLGARGEEIPVGPCESQVIPSSSLRVWPRPPPLGAWSPKGRYPCPASGCPTGPFLHCARHPPLPSTHPLSPQRRSARSPGRPLHAQQQGPSAGLQLLLMEAVGDEGDAQLAQGFPHRVVTLQAAPASSGTQVQEQQKC